MNKVICDVCGTSFPETGTHCPICGCAKSPAAEVVVDEETPVNQSKTMDNNYGKGGRFAKGNTRRPTQSRPTASRSYESRSRDREPEQTNKSLIAVVVILLLAIVAVVIYIGVSVFFSDFGTAGGTDTTGSTVGINGGTNVIACTGLDLRPVNIELNAAGKSQALAATVTPTDTTEALTFTSSDPSVATVDNNGLVIGVGYGRTTITVKCGAFEKTCEVVCTFGQPPVDTTPSTPALPAGFVLKLKTYKDSGEITLAGDGVATLYSETMGVKASDITWTTSDPAIATVENGKVTGVGKGYCYITATIGNQTASCKVICTSNATPPSDYAISHVDVTIKVGETFNLSLKHKETGANVQGIVWTASQDGVVKINGNKITGQTVCSSGVQVFVEYEGVRYACRIIVKPAE